MCWGYTWAGNGMLQSVMRPDRKTVEFKYDALGRRTAKVFDGQVTRFVWDGNHPLHEWRYLVMEEEKFSIMTGYLGTPTQMYDKYGIKIWLKKKKKVVHNPN